MGRTAKANSSNDEWDWEDWADGEGGADGEGEAETKPAKKPAAKKADVKAKAEKPAAKKAEKPAKKPAAKKADAKAEKPKAEKPKAEKPKAEKPAAKTEKPARAAKPKTEKPATKTATGAVVEVTAFRTTLADGAKVLCIQKDYDGKPQEFNKAHFKKGALKDLLNYDFKAAGYICDNAKSKELRTAMKEAGYKLALGKAPVADEKTEKPARAAKPPKTEKTATSTKRAAKPKTEKTASSASSASSAPAVANVKLNDRKAYNSLRSSLRDTMVMLEARYGADNAQNALAYAVSRGDATLADFWEKRNG